MSEARRLAGLKARYEEEQELVRQGQTMSDRDKALVEAYEAGWDAGYDGTYRGEDPLRAEAVAWVLARRELPEVEQVGEGPQVAQEDVPGR